MRSFLILDLIFVYIRIGVGEIKGEKSEKMKISSIVLFPFPCQVTRTLDEKPLNKECEVGIV